MRYLPVARGMTPARPSPNDPNDERGAMPDSNPIPGSAHPMCDCPERHAKDCFFFDEWIDDGLEEPVLPLALLSGAGNDWWRSSWTKCHHNMSPVVLPSGLTVYASAWKSVPYDRTPPDVGCYFDASWFPTESFAYVIGWPDFGLPSIPDADVMRTARAVLQHAEYGEAVEVGCLGAHGRTGTFLALLVMLDSRNTSDVHGYKRAISYVREHHCSEAIETKSQEQYIRRMSAKLLKGLV